MRRSFTLCSIVVHAVIITAALIAQVVAVGALPDPHRPMMFDSIAIHAGRYPVAEATGRAADQRRQHRLSLMPRRSRRPTGSAPRSNGIAPCRLRSDRLTAARAGRRSGSSTSASPPPCRRRAPAAPPPPMRLHSGMKAPVKTVDVAPIYPMIAQAGPHSGRGDSRSGARRAGAGGVGASAAIDSAARSGGDRRGAAVALHAGPAERPGGAGGHDGDGQLHAAVAGPSTRVSVARSMLPPLITQTIFLPAS